MSLFTNDQFSDWNHGTSFSGPSANTQLADNWYAVGGGSFFRNANDWNGSFDYTSPYYMVAVGGSFYQDITLPGPISGLFLEYSFVSNITPNAPTITIHDGIQSDSVVTPTLIVGPVSPVAPKRTFVPFVTSASTLRITVYGGNGIEIRMMTGVAVIIPQELITISESLSIITSGERNLADVITISEALALAHTFPRTLTEEVAMVDSLSFLLNPPLTLSLNDAIGFTDSLNTAQSKGFDESVLMQDWVRIRKSIPESIWSS